MYFSLQENLLKIKTRTQKIPRPPTLGVPAALNCWRGVLTAHAIPGQNLENVTTWGCEPRGQTLNSLCTPFSLHRIQNAAHLRSAGVIV